MEMSLQLRAAGRIFDPNERAASVFGLPLLINERHWVKLFPLAWHVAGKIGHKFAPLLIVVVPIHTAWPFACYHQCCGALEYRSGESISARLASDGR